MAGPPNQEPKPAGCGCRWLWHIVVFLVLVFLLWLERDNIPSAISDLRSQIAPLIDRVVVTTEPGAVTPRTSTAATTPSPAAITLLTPTAVPAKEVTVAASPTQTTPSLVPTTSPTPTAPTMTASPTPAATPSMVPTATASPTPTIASPLAPAAIKSLTPRATVAINDHCYYESGAYHSRSFSAISRTASGWSKKILIWLLAIKELSLGTRRHLRSRSPRRYEDILYICRGEPFSPLRPS